MYHRFLLKLKFFQFFLVLIQSAVMHTTHMHTHTDFLFLPENFQGFHIFVLLINLVQ